MAISPYWWTIFTNASDGRRVLNRRNLDADGNFTSNEYFRVPLAGYGQVWEPVELLSDNRLLCRVHSTSLGYSTALILVDLVLDADTQPATPGTTTVLDLTALSWSSGDPGNPIVYASMIDGQRLLILIDGSLDQFAMVYDALYGTPLNIVGHGQSALIPVVAVMEGVGLVLMREHSVYGGNTTYYGCGPLDPQAWDGVWSDDFTIVPALATGGRFPGGGLELASETRLVLCRDMRGYNSNLTIAGAASGSTRTYAVANAGAGLTHSAYNDVTYTLSGSNASVEQESVAAAGFDYDTLFNADGYAIDFDYRWALNTNGVLVDTQAGGVSSYGLNRFIATSADPVTPPAVSPFWTHKIRTVELLE